MRQNCGGVDPRSTLERMKVQFRNVEWQKELVEVRAPGGSEEAMKVKELSQAHAWGQNNNSMDEIR